MKRVAVIGAGASGLPCIKACLEVNLEVVCYELTSKVGGLWNYEEEDTPGRATVFYSVIANSGREMNSYSDFPQPADNPIYSPHKVFAEYFQSYAKNFDLLRHIRFRHKVLKVSYAHDYSTTGKWLIEVRNEDTGTDEEEIFDLVMVAAGHHAFPKMPSVSGQEIFKGEQIHSQQYRRPDKFKDKKVLAVGFGNSGADIAVDLTNAAEKVYYSTRRRGWMFPRILTNGILPEMAFTTRLQTFIDSLKPLPLLCQQLEDEVQKVWNFEQCGLKPDHTFFEQYPVVNDILPLKVISGQVKLVDGIDHLTENGVVFKGDNKVTEMDAIVYCTGYRAKFPFLVDILDVENDIANFYKLVYPQQLQHNSLVFIGLADPDLVPIVQVSELQARWVVQIFKGNLKLPNVETMVNEIKFRQDIINFGFKEGYRLKTFLLARPYVDDLADQLGVKPNLFTTFFKDPKLFWALMTCPWVAYQYRLVGPHNWDGARGTLLGLTEKVNNTFKRSKAPKQKNHKNKIKLLAVPGALFLVYYLYKKPQTLLNMVKNSTCKIITLSNRLRY